MRVPKFRQKIAELFSTSIPNINIYISNLLGDNELDDNSVIKYYLITAADGKDFNVKFYSLDTIFAVGLPLSLVKW